MLRSRFLLPFLTAAALTGCNLQKEIDVPTPNLPTQLVVECYLTPGQPYRLIVQRTQPFDAPPPISGDSLNPILNLDFLSSDAVVTISGPRGATTMNFSPAQDLSSVHTRFFTHTSTAVFDGQPGEVFTLEVTDSGGRRVTGSTTVLAPVPIDTVEVSYNPDAPFDEAKAAFLTRYLDPPTPGDAYRYQTNRVKSGQFERQQSFELDDTRINGGPSAVGSSFRFSQGDTLDVALHHISLDYLHFLESVDAAEGANGNPFAQPASIKSTVQGGIGVFTSIATDRRLIILKR
jgi:Domain of unknown function (DUF4249)